LEKTSQALDVCLAKLVGKNPRKHQAVLEGITGAGRGLGAID
jgi:hypothetical protein